MGVLWEMRNGKDGNLLNPQEVNPYLDKVVLWFEDADMAEEPTTFQAYSDKLAEVEEFIKKEGAPYFEKKAKESWTVLWRGKQCNLVWNPDCF